MVLGGLVKQMLRGCGGWEWPVRLPWTSRQRAEAWARLRRRFFPFGCTANPSVCRAIGGMNIERKGRSGRPAPLPNIGPHKDADMKANFLLRNRKTKRYCQWQMPGCPLSVLVFHNGQHLMDFRNRVVPKAQRKHWEAVKVTDEQLKEISGGQFYLFLDDHKESETADYMFVPNSQETTVGI